MSPRTILVIEDDSSIRRGVVDALRFSGFEVIEAGEGKTGMETALRATFDLVLLDLGLPNFSCFEILAALKEHRPGTPVIILSARGEEADRVKGLKLGADDYVVKPFSVRELLARVEAVLRRTMKEAAEVIAKRTDLSKEQKETAIFKMYNNYSYGQIGDPGNPGSNITSHAYLVDNPMTCVVEGAMKSFSMLNVLRRNLPQV